MLKGAEDEVGCLFPGGVMHRNNRHLVGIGGIVTVQFLGVPSSSSSWVRAGSGICVFSMRTKVKWGQLNLSSWELFFCPLVLLGFKLRASVLLSKYSTT
jgi:hypothetical protein